MLALSSDCHIFPAHRFFVKTATGQRQKIAYEACLPIRSFITRKQMRTFKPTQAIYKMHEKNTHASRTSRQDKLMHAACTHIDATKCDVSMYERMNKKYIS